MEWKKNDFILNIASIFINNKFDFPNNKSLMRQLPFLSILILILK